MPVHPGPDPNPSVSIARIHEDDRESLRAVLRDRWGSPEIVSRGRVHDAGELPGFVAWSAGRRVGFLTYREEGTACELVTLDAIERGRGVGRSLVAAFEEEAARRGWTRLWLVTTNDNRPARRFYEGVGWRFVTVHRGALARARELKPEIPFTGVDGTPIVDEHEFERRMPGPENG